MEDDFGECNSCPGFKRVFPNQCAVQAELKKLIGRHSGMTKGSPNRMEIQVTRCHHKTRIIKEANQKKEQCPNCGHEIKGSQCTNCGLQDVI